SIAIVGPRFLAARQAPRGIERAFEDGGDQRILGHANVEIETRSAAPLARTHRILGERELLDDPGIALLPDLGGGEAGGRSRDMGHGATVTTIPGPLPGRQRGTIGPGLAGFLALPPGDQRADATARLGRNGL